MFSILAGRAQGTELSQRFCTRKLLEALARIALAVDYAHQRGVIHRDLKPANLMLGEFGEVFVLDWGIARTTAIVSDEPSTSGEAPAVGMTAEGSLLGTPGYMSPEQARGGGGQTVHARSDVYALGCVLFEILTTSALHLGARVTVLLVSTLTETTERSPAQRSPGTDVAPELDQLCLAATHFDREERLPTMRALADAIERYLEGDRDQAARALAADGHASRAAEQAKVALAESRPGEDARRQALYDVGRALALSPEHPQATATLVALLTEPPAALPEEVQGELDDLVSEHVRVGGRIGAVAYGRSTLIFALLLGLGVIRWASGAWLPVLLFGAAGIIAVMLFSFVLTTALGALALGPFRDDLDREQRGSRLLSWQLRQFVPRARLRGDTKRDSGRPDAGAR